MKVGIKYLAILLFSTTVLTACVEEPIDTDSTALSAPSRIPYAPGTPSFTLTTSAPSVAAGSAITLTVTSLDAHGNPYSAGVNSISFNLSGGTSTGSIGAILPKGYGVFEASFTGNVAGTATTVHAVVNGNTIASTVNIAVTTGEASALQVVDGNSQASQLNLNFAINPKVKVVDKYGNPIAGVPVTFDALNIGDYYPVTTTNGVKVGATPTPTPVPAPTTFTSATSSVNGGATATVNTDSNGFAQTVWAVSNITGLAVIKVSTPIASGVVLNTITGTAYAKPSTPDLFITGVNGKIDLAWTIASYGATSIRFSLYRSLNPGSGFYAITSNSSTFLHSDVDATTGVYYYKLIANNGYMDSDPSPVVSNNITVTNVWTMLTANSTQFTYDNTKINFANDVCSLTPTVQTDNSVSGFSSGTNVGTSLVGSSIVISNAGTCDATQTDCNPDNELSASWLPTQYAGLVGYWKGNGTAGTITNGAPIPTSVGSLAGTAMNGGTNMAYTNAGKLSQAIYMDGVDDAINIPNGFTNTIKADDTHTIMMWIKFNNVGASKVQLEAYNTVSGSGYFLENNASNGFYWASGGVYRTYTGMGLQNGRWYHVALVKTGAGNSGNLYLNGVLQTTYTGTLGNTPNENSALYIGRYRSAGYFHQGSFDDISIWNTPLSQTDVLAIYNKQASTKAGVFTSRIMDGLSSAPSWTKFSWWTSLPFQKALPDFAGGIQNETSTDYASLIGSTGSSFDNNEMLNIAGLWHLDEAAGTVGGGSILDKSGAAKNGTPTGGVAFGGDGKFGSGATFNGTNGSIQLTSATTSSTTVSFSAWIKPLNNNLMNIMGGSGIFQYLSYQTSNFWVHDGSVWRVVGNVPPNVWTHVALSYNSTNKQLKLYVNGVILYNDTGAATFGASSATSIGWYGWSAIRYFAGGLDEVAVWNRILSPDEILQVYRRGANRIKLQVRTCNAANCSDGVWKGPNGSPTYFTEHWNRATQAVTPSGGQKITPPSMTFSNFASPVSAKRYFQYRAVLESDDVSTLCGGASCSPELLSTSVDPIHYQTSGPTVVTNNSVPYTKLLKITETLGASCSSGVSYNLSLDKITWYYWNSAASLWSVANGTTAQSNNITSLMGVGAIANFQRSVGTGTVYVKAFLKSTGTSKCELAGFTLMGQ